MHAHTSTLYKMVALLLCSHAYVPQSLQAQSLWSGLLQARHLSTVREKGFLTVQTAGGNQKRRKHLGLLTRGTGIWPVAATWLEQTPLVLASRIWSSEMIYGSPSPRSIGGWL